MWTLRNAGASPFGRKAEIAAALCGFRDSIRVEQTDTSDPALAALNPLGKIPTLVLEDGTTLFDSRVIAEFFDMEAGGGVIIPAGGRERIAALRLQALADGMMDASVLVVYEGRFRPPELHSAAWVERQRARIDRALAVLEADLPQPARLPHIGQVALACALGYLDLRFEGNWRAGHPRLVAWLDAFAEAVPAYGPASPS